MEQNLPIITKKLWNMVRLAFFMLRKGITKKKFLLHINVMMKRGKIASKVALNNLIFHHYHHHPASPFRDGVPKPSHLQSIPTDAFQEYEISCPNTPVNEHYYTPSTTFGGTVHTDSFESINKMLVTMSSSKGNGVRQLRITDSPFPLQSEENCDHRVDQAADAFIKRFYSQLKEQYCE